jgi:hypothetical protein
MRFGAGEITLGGITPGRTLGSPVACRDQEQQW